MWIEFDQWLLHFQDKVKLGKQRISFIGTSLGVPVVKTSPSSTGAASSIPGQGAKLSYASRSKSPKHKMKLYYNKFSKDLENGLHQNKIFKKIFLKDFLYNW